MGDVTTECLLLLLPLPSSMLGLPWSLSSSSPLRVVAIGIVSGVNDVMSGCPPVVALTAAITVTLVVVGIVVEGCERRGEGVQAATIAVIDTGLVPVLATTATIDAEGGGGWECQ